VKRLALVLAAGAALAFPTASALGGSAALGGDWGRFGYDAARHNSGPAKTGITAANVAGLHRQAVRLDGTVDSSPIYLRGIAGKDLFVVTTTYGKTEAINASSGAVVWRYTPPGYASFAGSAQITTATPVADPSRRYVYAASPDGHIVKLSLADGKPAWSTSITRDPTHEKIAAALNLGRGMVYAVTGGYIGDAPPYQGHVVALSAASGRILHVWNSLCSNRPAIIQPSSCGSSDSAIWARSGAVIVPGTGQILVATGNGPWNGQTDWGDSVLLLSPSLTLLRNWTPANQKQLEAGDVDLGSTAPALLARGLAVQGGKDGRLRLLRVSRLSGKLGATGGELQTVDLPGTTDLFSAPAVWRGTWVFVANSAGTQAWRLVGTRLRLAWQHGTGGTSPVVAGGLVYVYDLEGGGLHVYAPGNGKEVAVLPAGAGHWQSPIVTDGRIALPEGNANDHRRSGVLNIYR
jgi:outer membrane protein assembly factor BamB